jgi:hypothetical protein
VHEFLATQREVRHDEGGFTVVRGRAAPNPVTEPFQLPPCTLVPERIRDLNIYTFVDGRSHLPWQKLLRADEMVRTYWVGALRDDQRKLLELPYLDVLNVRYVLSTEPLLHAGRRVGPELRGPPIPRADGSVTQAEFFVYERPNPLPRAFMVNFSNLGYPFSAATDEDAVGRLAAPDYDPRSMVWVSVSPATRLLPLGSPADHSHRRVRFVKDTPTEVHLAVEAGDIGFLVLSDTLMGGWTATIDGEPVEIARGNLTMRTLAIGHIGPCDVVFRYSTPRLTAGFLVTLASLLALFVLLRFKRRRP